MVKNRTLWLAVLEAANGFLVCAKDRLRLRYPIVPTDSGARCTSKTHGLAAVLAQSQKGEHLVLAGGWLVRT